MKKSFLPLLIISVLCSLLLPAAVFATARPDGKEIIELTQGIEHRISSQGFTTFVNTEQLPPEIASAFTRIGVASYGGQVPDVSRFKWVDFITASSLYDNTRGYGSSLPRSGVYNALAILYDKENMPLAYSIQEINFTQSSGNNGGGTGSEPVNPTLKASSSNITLAAGDFKQIKLTAILANGSAKDVTQLAKWTTDDSEIADVDSGEVEGISEGTTAVTAFYNGLTVNVQVNVTTPEEDTLAEYVSLVASDKNIKLLPGDEKIIRIYGITGEGKKVEVTDEVLWQSSKSEVVDADGGVLTAGKAGKAVIYVSYGSTELAFNVEVIKEKAVKSVSVLPAKLTMKKGEEKDLTATATYVDNVSVDITERAEWISKNSGIVQADGGTLTAVKKGKAIVVVKYKGKFTNIEVTVK